MRGITTCLATRASTRSAAPEGLPARSHPPPRCRPPAVRPPSLAGPPEPGQPEGNPHAAHLLRWWGHPLGRGPNVTEFTARRDSTVTVGWALSEQRRGFVSREL